MTDLVVRLAEEADLPALTDLMRRSIAALQTGFLTLEQIVASHKVMGLDTQLLRDRSYYLVEAAGTVVGCGGWSRRATLYGGDASVVARDAALLDPARDAARIRAMYTHPEHARRGIGRMVLARCERAAAEAGFGRVELMGTLSGQPLYRACGYAPIERVDADADGVTVPMIRMGKILDPVSRG